MQNIQYRKFSISFYVVVVIFWITNIYGTSDLSGWFDPVFGNKLPPLITRLLIRGYPNENGFVGVEWGIIIFSTYIIVRYYNYYRNYNFYNKFLLLFLIIYLFILLNPNNSSDFLRTFFSKQSRFILLMPLFFVSLNYLENDMYAIIMNKVWRIGFIVIIFKAVVSMIYYVSGHGMQFVTLKGTILQEDVLIYIGLVQLFYLYMYLHKGKKKNLLLSLFLLLVIILSMRRTETYAFMISSLVFLTYYFYKKKRISLFFSKLIPATIVFSILLYVLSFSNVISVSSILSRNISIFSYFNPNLQDQQLHDSKHFLQSITTSEVMLNNLSRFWGSGLKNTPYVYGQTAAIHNSFAYNWAKFGLPVLFLYTFLFLRILMLLLKASKLSFKNGPNSYSLSLKFLALFLLFMTFIMGWSSSFNIFTRNTQNYITFIMLLSLLKINKDNIHLLIPQFRNDA